MTYDIYWGAGSPNSWRTLLGLEVKGLKYNSNLLEFSKKEHQTQEMLSLNPRGQLPILKDGNNSVFESIAILAYLDQQNPDKPLFGSTPIETGYIWQRVFEVENYLCTPLLDIIRPVFFDDVNDNIDAIVKAASYVHAEFKTIEPQLSARNYLAGEKISAADVVVFPMIQALLRALSLPEATSLKLDFLPFASHYPNISNWIERITTIPGYENTYPPNW